KTSQFDCRRRVDFPLALRYQPSSETGFLSTEADVRSRAQQAQRARPISLREAASIIQLANRSGKDMRLEFPDLPERGPRPNSRHHVETRLSARCLGSDSRNRAQ